MLSIHRSDAPPPQTFVCGTPSLAGHARVVGEISLSPTALEMPRIKNSTANELPQVRHSRFHLWLLGGYSLINYDSLSATYFVHLEAYIQDINNISSWLVVVVEVAARSCSHPSTSSSSFCSNIPRSPYGFTSSLGFG
jgi:hypothetical protein